MNEYLWTATDTHGIFEARVRRLAPYKGMFELVRVANNEVVRNQEVRLAFDARFGPDVDDSTSWCRLAEQWTREAESELRN